MRGSNEGLSREASLRSLLNFTLIEVPGKARSMHEKSKPSSLDSVFDVVDILVRKRNRRATECCKPCQGNLPRPNKHQKKHNS